MVTLSSTDQTTTLSRTRSHLAFDETCCKSIQEKGKERLVLLLVQTYPLPTEEEHQRQLREAIWNSHSHFLMIIAPCGFGEFAGPSSTGVVLLGYGR